MKSRIRTPYLGLFVLIAGAALCTPQIAGALPGHSAAAPASQSSTKFPGCKPHLQVSATAASVAPVGCPQTALLVSYAADSLKVGVTIHQTLFAQGKHSVALPPCAWQVDFISGPPVIPVITTSDRYTKSGQFIAGRIGGTPCPTTTTTVATTTTTIPTVVLGTSIVPPATDPENDHDSDDPTTTAVSGTQTLPRTGAPHVGLEALLGLGMMAVGGSILGADRRRRRVTA